MKSFFEKIIFLLGESRTQLPRIIVSFVLISILDLISIGLIGPFLGIVFGGIENLPKPFVQALSLFHYSHEDIITIIAIALVTIYAVKSIFSALIMKTVINFSQNQQVYIRRKLITAYQTMPYSRVMQRNSSDYVNAIQVLVPNFANLVMFCLQALGDSIVAIMVIGFLAWTNPFAFGFLAVVTGICLLLFDLFIRNRMTAAGRNSNVSSASIVRYTNESIRGFKEIRILRQEKFFNQKLVNSASTFASSQILINFFSMLPKYIFEMIIIIFICGVSVAASYMIDDPVTLIPTLGVFGMASIRLVPLARSLSFTLGRIRSSKDTVMKLASDLEKTEYEAEILTTKKLPTTSIPKEHVQTIKLNRVSFTYPGATTKALDKISLTISAGNHIGIIGSSGAGKTTLVDTLLGLLTPSEGQVLFNGKDITNNPGVLWQNVAYLPQEIFIIDDTVAQNIALGVDENQVDQKQLLYAISKAQISDVIEGLPNGLMTNLGENGVKLSGGQRQRIALARAFYFNRSVLVLDEATSSLDMKIEKNIIDYLKNLKSKVTIISITHRVQSLEHSDQIFQISNGKLTEYRY